LNLLDRYIVKQFVFTLFFAIIALCTIFLVVNLLENLDKFLDQNATFEIIAKYYLYFFPEIIKLLTPVATLISTLFTIGRLSTLNEITAMKSGGQSLYRLMLPLLLVTIVLSFLNLYFNGWVVPKANESKKLIEQKYLSSSNHASSLYNLYLRDTPTRNLIIQFYDATMKQGNRISIEDFSDENKPRIIRRLEANTVTWDTTNNKWVGADVLIREFDSDGAKILRFDTCDVDIRLKHNEIEQLKREPSEMNFDELRTYIAILKLGGKDVRKQLIAYYSAWAFPFANLVVVLFGVPFASVRRKGGIAIQIGAAMIIAFSYMIFTEVSKTISFAYNLDPILAGWIANLIFIFAGLIIIFKTRT